MRHSMRLRAGLPLLLALALATGCSDADATRAAVGEKRSAKAPAVRERDPEVEALRRALDLGRLDEAEPSLRKWRAGLGLEGELLAARAAALGGASLEASRCIEAARALDPTDARVYATAAELHAAAGRFETAGQEIRRGFEACGSTPELLRAQGIVFLCQPRGAAKGLELIEGALARDPRLPFVDRALSQAHLLLGKEELSANRPVGAIEHARASLSHDPEDVDARRFFADALMANHELGAAVSVLQQLVDEGQPLQAELAMHCKRAAMGELLLRRRAEALEYFRRARELGLAPQELGTGAHMLLEAADEAIEAGVAAYSAEDLELARAQFARALELDPDSIVAHNHMGVVLFREKEYAAAAREWQRVLDTALAEELELPSPVHLNLAKALFQDGRAAEARAVVEAYLEREPEGEWAADSRAVLRDIE